MIMQWKLLCSDNDPVYVCRVCVYVRRLACYLSARPSSPSRKWPTARHRSRSCSTSLIHGYGALPDVPVLCLLPTHFTGTLMVLTNGGRLAEWAWVTSYISRWFTCSQTITHPCTNRRVDFLNLFFKSNAFVLYATHHTSNIFSFRVYSGMVEALKLMYTPFSLDGVSKPNLTVTDTINLDGDELEALEKNLSQPIEQAIHRVSLTFCVHNKRTQVG